MVFIAESLVYVSPSDYTRTHVRQHRESGPGRVPDRGQHWQRLSVRLGTLGALFGTFVPSDEHEAACDD